MIKWLLVIGVIVAIYYFFIKKSTPPKRRNSSKEGVKPKTGEEVEEMVECSRCGVYVEIEEAIISNGKYYCSKECLKG